MAITLTTFESRKRPQGVEEEYTWEELVDRLSSPTVTSESMAEYKAMTNEERTEVKDIGGYVGGAFVDAKRSKDGLKYRSLLVIDADHATDHDVEDYELLYDTVFLCHSTHSSTPEAPRLRWIFPLSRPVTPDEYRQLANIVAEWVGEETIDETTDQPERLMFWPSVSKDAEYLYWTGGTKFLDPDEYLDEDLEPTPEPTPPKPEPSPVSSDGTLVICEGQRNKTIFGFAASLRSQGLDRDGIRFMVDDYNDRYCAPPLQPAELDTIVRSVCTRYKPGEAVHPTLRDAWDDFNDLGEWKETKPAPIKHLEAESLASLNGRHVDAPVYVVDSLIANGITILASPPKFGKSWMCMDLAISVANGTEFMGLATHKEGVIYLALEDGDYRLQERGRKVAGDRPIPDNLYLVKEAPQLQDGLLGMLNALVESCESVGMVIIDTLQMIRGVAGKTEGVYGYDYRELGQLHKYALDNNISVVLVHHLNKYGDDSDFVSRLNGSTGVSGAADTIITLTRGKRGDDTTKMSITGRDVTERTLVIQMDWSNYRWICLGDERDVERDAEEYAFQNDPVVKTILYRLDEAEELLDPTEDEDQVTWVCTSSQLLSAVEALYGPQDASPTAIGMKVKKYQAKLESSYGIGYGYRTPHGKREHVFTRELI